MDDVSWGALALALTLVGGTYTWWAYQRRGLAPALRGAAITLLPLAAYLTKTLRMFTRIADAIGDWATTLVLNPGVWIGIALVGVSVVLLGASRVVDRRGGGPPVEKSSPKQVRASKQERSGKARPAIDGDDDLAEIEAILRKRGIT